MTQPPLVSGRREYADIKYGWDFGDDEKAVWATDGLPKNHETGYLASHVYETPGSYTVKLSVTTETGVETHTATITVDDPDRVYAGTKTTCVSTGRDFTGCPAGAAQVTTAAPADFEKYLGAGKRLLLRRGDSWTNSKDSVSMSNRGPATIGAFGSCSQPSRFGNCANAPLVNGTGNDSSALFNQDKTTDTRVMDLKFVVTKSRYAFGGATEIHKVLFLRVAIEGGNTAIGNSPYKTSDADGIAIVNSEIHNQDTNGIFLGSTQMALLGNEIKDINTSHVVRVWQAYRATISHNEISGSSVQSDAGRHALKVHGPSESDVSEPGDSHVEHRTQFAIISNNLFGSSGPWPVVIGPQNGSVDERLEDILFEKNRVYPAYGTPSAQSGKVEISVYLSARNSTVRNNVFSALGAGPSFIAVQVAPRGIEPTGLNDRVFNNTVYFPAVGRNQKSVGVITLLSASGSIIRNNLIQMPSGDQSGPILQDDQGEGTIADHNLLTADAGFVDPSNSNVLLTDYSLAQSSEAIDKGVSVPVYDDFAGNPRPSAGGFDIGAFERPKHH